MFRKQPISSPALANPTGLAFDLNKNLMPVVIAFIVTHINNQVNKMSTTLACHMHNIKRIAL